MSWITRAAMATMLSFIPYTVAFAQPLVTGNLTFYYDFDEIVTNADGEKQFLGEAGHGFVATVFEGDPEVDIEPGTLTVETDNPFRGAGAARFTQSTEAADLPVYLDLDGRNVTENFPQLLPAGGLNEQFGLSVAAWLNVSANDVSDQSVFQGQTSDGGHGNPHFQLQGNGKLRMTFRDQTGTNVVNAPQVYVDGTEDSGEAYPIDEWFHYAGTYDADLGEWAMYYNGQIIQSGESDGLDLGDWGGLDDNLFGAGIGVVYDSGGRRLDGAIDEFYVFNRGLTAEEVAILATPVTSVTGDCNDDGSLTALDLPCVSTIAERNAVLDALGTLPGDLDGDGAVAFADFLTLSGNFGKSGLGYSDGNVDLVDDVAFADFLALSGNFGKTPAAGVAVPEPNGLVILSGALMLLSLARQRR